MDARRRWLLRGLTYSLGAGMVARPAVAAPVASKVVRVSGNLAAPSSYTAADLARFPPQKVNFKAPDGKVRKYTGALLRDVLTACKPTEPDHNALRQSYVLAKGADDYFALFSWAELFISPIGDHAMLVYLREGKPLADDEGAIALISLSDTRPGPRYVKWLSAVDFRRAAI